MLSDRKNVYAGMIEDMVNQVDLSKPIVISDMKMKCGTYWKEVSGVM